MSYSEDNSFEKILTRCLSDERFASLDVREGSVIYDALAPVCLELAEAYVKMDLLEKQTFLLTSTGTNLDNRVYDYGLSRESATYALRIAEFKQYKTKVDGTYYYDDNGDKILVNMDIDTGVRFAVPNSSTTYEYIGKIDGHHILRCEQTGTVGNNHLGTILPLTPVNGLIEASITSTYQYGEDEETDDELRERAVNSLNYASFGGNIEDYIEKTNSIDGVGNTKVFPAWQYNGSVLLSIVSPEFDPVTDAFTKVVKEELDPENSTGQGVGTAPIGHYVTVTTPVKQNVTVEATLELDSSVTLETIQEDVEAKLEEYFLSVRQSFAQNVDLTLYRARIIEKVLELTSILNIKNVKLNGEEKDLTFTDEAHIGMQYLPYLDEVVLL